MSLSKKSFWLQYDLGLNSNYSGLFRFLDDNHAIECGNGLAYFTYNTQSFPIDVLVFNLTEDIVRNLSPIGQERLYLIWKEDFTNKIKGKFIYGSRKTPPWRGYGSMNETNSEEIAE